MAIPTFVSVGALAANTGTVTVSSGSGLQRDDLLLLFVETADQNLSTPSTWSAVSGSPVSVSGQTRLYVFERTATGTGTHTADLSDSGDHQIGVIAAFRGVGTTGRIHVVQTDSGTEVGVNQTFNMAGPTTTEDDCLIVGAVTHSIDAAGASFSSLTNANLANLAERFDNGSTVGNGAGLLVWTGELASQGAVGDTTVVNNRTNPSWASVVLALKPRGTAPANDNFANREIIPTTPAPSADVYESTTEDASLETSEPDAPQTSFLRTSWWEYTPEITHLLEVTLSNDDASTGVTHAMPRRGTSVAGLSVYGSPQQHAGFNGGVGIDTFFNGVEFDDLTPVAQVYQVSPSVPLVIQAGLRIGASFADREYNLLLNALTPPDNDDIGTALDLVGTSGSEDFDMATATGQEGWTAEQLAFIGTSPFGSAMVADIFYRINVEEESTLVFRINQQAGFESDDISRLRVALFSGAILSELEFITELSGPFSGGDRGFEAAILEPLTDYYLVVFQTRIWNTVSPAQRDKGMLEWTLSDAPPNDLLENAHALAASTSGNDTVADVRGATFEEEEESLQTGLFGDHSVWYAFSCVQSGWYDIDFLESHPVGGGYRIDVYRGTSYDDLEPVGIAFTGNNWFPLRAGETYLVRFYSESGWDGDEIVWSLEIA